MTMHYHGTPITPRSVLHTLAGKNFCVSYARPEDIRICHEIGQSVMLDNGAFTTWRQGREMDWYSWAEWASPWLDYPTTWCVLPDSIEGGEEENDRLLSYSWDVPGSPVWHLHESIDRLLRLTDSYARVCFGSSGEYRVVGSDSWHRRITEAFNAISARHTRLPWIHMLRGMALAGAEYPFASLDSTDVARNHNRNGNTARAMADRWDSLQCPAQWQRIEQLSIGAA
jgi:hypothetical protein